RARAPTAHNREPSHRSPATASREMVPAARAWIPRCRPSDSASFFFQEPPGKKYGRAQREQYELTTLVAFQQSEKQSDSGHDQSRELQSAAGGMHALSSRALTTPTIPSPGSPDPIAQSSPRRLALRRLDRRPYRSHSNEAGENV